MPIVGENFMAQVMQATEQSQATLTQFAVAMAKLRAAERQYQQNTKFQQEAFQFEREKFQAQQELNAVRIDTMKEQLGAAQAGREQIEADETALEDFYRGPFRMVQAARAELEANPQDPEAQALFAQSQAAFESSFLGLPLGAMERFSRLETARATTRSQEALTAQRLSQAAQPVGALVSGGEAAEDALKIRDGLERAVSGDTWNEFLATHQKEQQAVKDQHEPGRRNLASLLREFQAMPEAAISDLIAGTVNVGQVIASLNKAGQTADTTQKARIEAARGVFSTWQEDVTRLQTEYRNRLQENRLFESALRFHMADITRGAATKPGSQVSLQAALEELAPAMRGARGAIADLTTSEEMAAYRVAHSPEDQATAEKRLIERINSLVGGNEPLTQEVREILFGGAREEKALNDAPKAPPIDILGGIGMTR